MTFPAPPKWRTTTPSVRLADTQAPIAWLASQGMMKPGVKAEQLVDKRYAIEAP